MKPVRMVRGPMLPLDRADVDTDQIIPQQFLKRIERDGYGEFLFYNWAHRDDGSPIEDFITNRPERSEAKILVAGRNFGCGSSREHAPWAIQDWGFDAVIAPSTADIFRNNSANIGLLIVELPEPEVRRLMDMAQDPTASVTIDLEQQTVVGERRRGEVRLRPIGQGAPAARSRLDRDDPHPRGVDHPARVGSAGLAPGQLREPNQLAVLDRARGEPEGIHQGLELIQPQRLWPVTERVLGMGVDLHHDPVRPDRLGGEGQRRNQVPIAGGM